MKADHPITIDRARSKAAAGGDWQNIDSVGKGRVQILPAGGDSMTQAVAVMTELQRLFAQAPDRDWGGTAVIAREWKYLEPVRSYCELNHIPVQMADEEAPHFWRLRETQTLVEWLRAQKIRLVDTGAIGRWLDRQSAGPWWSLLREAVTEYGLETGGAELPVGHFIEWLAEWGREVRRRQTGLMLLTAHRAKGLEFNHVAVLDGGWDRVGQNEDRDAPRRLYYVAMTRARKTLTLARFNGAHAPLDVLPDSASVLRRATTLLPTPQPELARHYARLSLRDVDLGFSGRRAPDHAVHQAIAALTPGDTLRLHREHEHWTLVDSRGNTVGWLARAYAPPAGTTCIAASVAAIIIREREDSEPEYHERLRSERWEVVVPDLVFAPGP
jgi:ATP-dependent DNA helicase RecQ